MHKTPLLVNGRHPVFIPIARLRGSRQVESLLIILHLTCPGCESRLLVEPTIRRNLMGMLLLHRSTGVLEGWSVGRKKSNLSHT
jgi:hypothetical protein